MTKNSTSVTRQWSFIKPNQMAQTLYWEDVIKSRWWGEKNPSPKIRSGATV